ncbi:MAG TPA: tetratricopeptide repeat protein [Candidatus Sulfotelmatobacter sp.]|nr:tetratricopeptide repeat protein [Candidatus Sulfotelmatobacter sp.]
MPPAGGWPLAAVALVAFGCVAYSVTFRMSTPDVWQHLLVGKALWQLGRIPQEHLWTWPMFGQPDVLPSWLFTVLLWPFWKVGGEPGLQVWRWLTTLGAFGIAWAVARRLGARGLTPLLVIAACALPYRPRSQVRPETLVAVLLALQLWVLERRRARAAGGAIGLVALAWVWANAHISYWLGLALIAIHLPAELRRRWPEPALDRADGTGLGARIRAAIARFDDLPLLWTLALCAAVSFLNPFGWRALWQPFEYFLTWRHEPVYLTIPELSPLWLTWRSHLRSGLPILVALWPLLAFSRLRLRRLDGVEVATATLFVALTLFNQRFAGFLVVAAAPYLARDLSELLGSLRWPASWTRPVTRAAMVGAAIVLAGIPEWGRPEFPAGIGFVATYYPGPACDFIEHFGLQGRFFNPYYFGGYLLWRFWPQRERLPFMDIHQSGSRRDRELYAYCFASPEAWNELMQERDFQLALLDGHQDWVENDHLMDRLDQDSTWALVFRDDASALYLRRSGATAEAARGMAFHVMPGGREALMNLRESLASNAGLRAQMRADLERCVRASPLSAQAQSTLANLDFLDGDRMGARRHLLGALQVDPRFYSAHRRLGYLALAEGDWGAAIAEFQKERAIGGPPVDEYQRLGEAWEKIGNRARAAQYFRYELQIHPQNDEARAGLQRVGG